MSTGHMSILRYGALVKLDVMASFRLDSMVVCMNSDAQSICGEARPAGSQPWTVVHCIAEPLPQLGARATQGKDSTRACLSMH